MAHGQQWRLPRITPALEKLCLAIKHNPLRPSFFAEVPRLGSNFKAYSEHTEVTRRSSQDQYKFRQRELSLNHFKNLLLLANPQ